MLHYPAQFKRAKEGGYVVTFRDIPEAITQGDTRDEALEMAHDALISTMDFYFEDQRPVPMPSAFRKGDVSVELPASLAAKVLLLNEMTRQKVRPAKLARLLDTSPQDVNRIIDLHHATKIDRIAEALSALGKHLHLSVVNGQA